MAIFSPERAIRRSVARVTGWLMVLAPFMGSLIIRYGKDNRLPLPVSDWGLR